MFNPNYFGITVTRTSVGMDGLVALPFSSMARGRGHNSAVSISDNLLLQVTLPLDVMFIAVP